MSTVKRRKTSELWQFFESIGNMYAKCNICKSKISFKATLSNLKKHMRNKHPTVVLPGPSKQPTKRNRHEKAEESNINEVVQSTDDPSSDPVSSSSSSSFQSNFATPRSTGVYRQRKLATIFGNQPISNQTKEQIDKNLVLLFILDIQSFSIVEDTGFKKFVSALNANYELPSRHTLSKTIIPALYEECVVKIRDIVSQGMQFCITTDCWTVILLVTLV